MTARDIIAKAISGAPFPSARSRSKAEQVIVDLEAAGFAVVPNEATEAMLNAAYGRDREGTERGNWRTMIEAAKENT